MYVMDKSRIPVFEDQLWLNNSARSRASQQIQAPRISYLPLLLPDIKKHLTDLVLDETNAGLLKEDDWWFEETERGGLMRW